MVRYPLKREAIWFCYSCPMHVTSGLVVAMLPCSCNTHIWNKKKELRYSICSHHLLPQYSICSFTGCESALDATRGMVLPLMCNINRMSHDLSSVVYLLFCDGASCIANNSMLVQLYCWYQELLSTEGTMHCL